MTRTNQDWLNDLQSKDVLIRDQATTELQRRLRRSIYKQFLGKGLVDSCIDDVVQETSYRIFARMDTFRGESAFMTWATAFAIRTGMEMIRRGFWSAKTATDFVMDGDRVDLANQWKTLALSPEDSAQQLEVLDLLSRVMNERLTQRQRCALLQKLRGWSVDQIQRELGTTRGAVYKLTHDARAKLKEALEEAGFDGDAIQDLFSK